MKAAAFATICMLLAGMPADVPAVDWPSLERQVKGQGGIGPHVLRDLKGPAMSGVRRLLHNAERTQYADGVAHYQFELRLGPGEFDVVRVHRVVRERRPYRPVRTEGAIFMLHGSTNTFGAVLLRAGTEVPDANTSMPIYLAANDIDVWGMDYAWTLVPAETTDFSFMQDWGIERDIDHALSAISLARVIRGLTGQDFGRMNVLGFSYSGWLAYVAAGMETRQHPFLRNIRGLVVLDALLKVSEEDEAYRLDACAGVAELQAMMDDGVYNTQGGIVLGMFSGLAATAPDDPSPFIPGLTNFQAALFVGAVDAPLWHFVGGEFDELGIPVGLRFTDPDRWIRLMGELPPYQPVLTELDLSMVTCDEEDVAYDDHLGDITVPILYLGAAGGIGYFGVHTPGLTASTDIMYHIVQSEDLDRALDFGHADLLTGYDAATRVWGDLLDWLVEH